MRSYFRRAAACFLLCALVLILAACGSASHAIPSLPGTVPVPAQSETPAVPTVQVPAASQAPVVSSDPFHTDWEPTVTGDVPAMAPDEVTRLTYLVGEEEVTVPAMLHYTLHGYSIVYDTEHYVCNAFTEGDSYWNSEGNYLAVNLIFGLPMEDVLAGLRLQEGIAMEPEAVSAGAEAYSALTLYVTTPSGLYRQFWAMDCGGDVLLVEQSYDTMSDEAPLLRSSQLAMLDTLTILY